jgi:hypothetical protein
VAVVQSLFLTPLEAVEPVAVEMLQQETTLENLEHPIVVVAAAVPVVAMVA